MDNYNSYNMGASVPVYLITGFLEGGKTSFLQETIEDPQFDTGSKTLVISCEEGETELDVSKAKRSKTILRTLESEEELTADRLSRWDLNFAPDRVLVEYNGMWMGKTFLEAMPRNWVIQQKFFFADGRSFLSYNQNMRSLVFDKLQNCDMVVFNRFPKDEDVMPYHKIVRAVNRAAGIVYEDTAGGLRYDEIVDPLPFDKSAKVIDIADRDFAIWYQDLNEELRSYNGKTVRFKAQLSTPSDLGKGTFLAGRHMMNCCAADIAYAGLIATDSPTPVKNGEWVDLTATVKIKLHKAYGGVGPVLDVQRIAPAQPPEELVASFY